MTERLASLPVAERQLLAAIAAAPAGQKLSIPQLRDALVSQADVLGMLQRLIDAGELDRATLRPPVVVRRLAPAPALRPTGAQLYKRLTEEGRARGVSITEVSRQVLGGPTNLYALKNASRPVRAATLDKAEAWLAAQRSPGPPPDTAVQAVKVAPGVRKSRPYCQLPGACVAPSRGGCPRCQPESRRRRSSASIVAGERAAAQRRKGATREAERLLERDPDATKGRNAGVTVAINQIRFRQASDRRESDPVEQAKVALQRKGLTVHDAGVTGGRKGFFIVSGQRDPDSGRLKELTPAAVIDLAERKTGLSFRRGASRGDPQPIQPGDRR